MINVIQCANMGMVSEVSHQLLINLLFMEKRISAIGVMTTEGIEDAYLVEENVNSDTFLQFFQRSLPNIIQPLTEATPSQLSF